MTTKAKYGDIVTVHFTCKLDDGSILDSSENSFPLEITIGKSGFMRGFERSFIGMEPGETKSVVITADEAYGPYKKELKQVLARDMFPGDVQPEVGMQIKVKQDNDEKVIRVVEVNESSVTLDANHPLAGKDLHFDIKLVSIIKPGPTVFSYYALGSTLEEQGFWGEALQHYRDAVEADPDFTDAWFRLGVLEQLMGQYEEAMSRYQRVLELQPDHEEAMINLGDMLRLKGDYAEAIDLLNRVVASNPEHASAHNTLGAALKDKGNLDEAIVHFEKALSLDPSFIEARYNLGMAYQEKANFSEAEHAFRTVIEMNGNLAEAHFNLAQVLLLTGKFHEGWEEYEWRLKLKETSAPILTKQWDGSDIAGRSILIIAEQGFGDTIQFIRYAPLLAKKQATVYVACQRELIRLFRQIAEIEDVIPFENPLPETDAQCYLLSLPRLFSTTAENIPARIPYLTADPSNVEQWKDYVADKRAPLKIGIAWSGDPTYKKDLVRSLNIEKLAPLLQVTGHAFYKLQKDLTEDHQLFDMPTHAIIDHTHLIEDFADTAAFIANLDLVISVDTAIAHLAGAIGKPVWTLLPYVPDWRWLLNRDDSPWYPTMRLFRQPSPGDWDSVMKRVAEELRKMV